MVWVRREWSVSVDWCAGLRKYGLSDHFLPLLDEDQAHTFAGPIPLLETALKAMSPRTTVSAALSPFYCLH